MKLKFYFGILFLCFSYTFAYSQKVTIRGYAKQGGLQVLKLVSISDYISNVENTLAYTEIAENETFLLEASVPKTQMAFLKIGLQKAEIYIEPGRNYEIQINYDSTRHALTFVDRKALDFTFVNPKAGELNLQIQDFNVLFNNFLIANFEKLYKKKQKHLVDTLQKKAANDFHTTSAFFKNYTKYRIASIEEPSGLKTKMAMFQSYFKDKEVLYHHVEYMDLFNRFFDRYISTSSQVISFGEFIRLINDNTAFGKLDAILAKDIFLQDAQLREMVIMKAFAEFYYHPGIHKKAVTGLLRQIQEESRFAENKLIANNLIQRFSHLASGSKAPDFKTKNLQGGSVTPADFAGKHVFINFWTLPCNTCIREMDSIAGLHNIYKDKVSFVSISYDLESAAVEELKKKKEFTWNFLIPEDDFQLVDDYQLRSLPTYLLIGPDGSIVAYPAIPSGIGFSKAFKRWFAE